MAETPTDKTTCCIVGGGPAGAMLGYLLARAGVAVTVLEKHDDFLRDFRGDTVHTSTLRLMDELGLGERFLALPHQVTRQLEGVVGGQRIKVADFNALGGRHPYIVFMPQWDFLNFITAEARRHTNFTLLMGAEATDILSDGEQVTGVGYRRGGEERRLEAHLTVACDGRDSLLRRAAKLTPIEIGAPMDVLWFRLARRATDPEQTQARIEAGVMMALIDRGDYWQCAYIYPKDGLDALRTQGIADFRSRIAALVPFLDAERLDTVVDWDDLIMLRVQINRLERWHKPGLLLIGDAAHAMSPVGGVGINLAIQDAVAAARILAGPLKWESVTEKHLSRVQNRRRYPAAATQAMQRFIQRRVITSVLSVKPLRVPRWLPWLLSLPPIRYLIARMIGIGFRVERINLP